MADRASRLTVADLVVLALLHERPMHGYAVTAELEEREVRDWAGISRPQVYYSLKKLAERGFTETIGYAAEDAAGPERRVYRPTAKGREALREALEREDWAEQRPPPPFLTWMALASHAREGALARQVARRRAFLLREAARERETLASMEGTVAGPGHLAARLMIELTVRQFEAELAWLEEVEQAFGVRGADERVSS